ncbi:NXPE family member 4-like [Ptychodera flava]|uniref:NXPE family member 4-like n=1 Tax=Ptychodera flava TaxID=63121 RepID=UPI00396A82CD
MEMLLLPTVGDRREPDSNMTLGRKQDSLFPYIDYDHFGMGWLGIVQEYEWSYKHLRRDNMPPQRHKSLEVAQKSFGPTSVTKSRVYLQNRRSTFKRGDFIHVIVEARDEYGNGRMRGGDFLAGVMCNGQFQKYTAGRTVDYGNGTYSMYFFAGWTGDASINVTLLFTREAVLSYDTARYKDRRLAWFVNFTDGKVIEKSNCTLANEGGWENKCSYSNMWSLGRTMFLCDKGKTLGCHALTNISNDLRGMFRFARDALKGKEYLFNGKFRNAQFTASPIKVKIEDSQKTLDIPACGPDLPVSMSSGYWASEKIFVPLMCRCQAWTPKERLQCASDKRFFLNGDSTLGQIHQLLLSKGIVGGTLETVFEYIALRVGNNVQRVNELMLEGDFIDKISTSTCRSTTPVVVFNFSFHYASWSIRAYLDRVYQTKLAVLRLLERCPKAIVIVKLAHPRDNVDGEQSVHSGNYLFYDMNRMVRRVFSGIGVNFLDLWDMVLSHPNENAVHLKLNVLIQQLDMMLCYICPDMVKEQRRAFA